MCITLGLGAYPFECEPKPGIGPTKEHKALEGNEVTVKENGDTHRYASVLSRISLRRKNVELRKVERITTIRSSTFFNGDQIAGNF